MQGAPREPTDFGGGSSGARPHRRETMSTACAVQLCALAPPTAEVQLDPAPLGAAVLRKMMLAGPQGEVSAEQDVLQFVDRSVVGVRHLMY